MCIRGNYLYISRLSVPSLGGYITRFHLDNKAHPILSNVSSMPGISAISTYGDLLYTTRWSLTSALNGLFIYDHDYVLQDSLTGAGSPNYMSMAVGGVRDGDYSYVVSYAEGRLNIVNVSDPTNIVLASSLSITAALDLASVIKIGDYCYLTGTLGNLYTIDVSRDRKSVV